MFIKYIWRASECYQIAVCLFEYFIHNSEAIYHYIYNSFIFSSPTPKTQWHSSTQNVFFSFTFYDKSSLRLPITQIVLNSKHDVYYIARFRKRALPLPSSFAAMPWNDTSSWICLFWCQNDMVWQTGCLYCHKSKALRGNFHVQPTFTSSRCFFFYNSTRLISSSPLCCCS